MTMKKIRNAGSRDICRISRLLAESWRTAYRGIIADDYLDALPDHHWVDFLTSGLAGKELIVLILEVHQELAGAAIVSGVNPAGKCCLMSFYLAPGQIGQGLGHWFYQELEAELRLSNYTLCTLDVLEQNTRAIRFYQDHGFTDTGSEVSAVLGKQTCRCRVFEKAL